MRILPLAANTIAATTSLVKTLVQVGETVLTPTLAPVAMFTKTARLEPDFPPGQSLAALDTVVKVASATSATQVDATDFGIGDTTITGVDCPMHLFTQGFGITAAELNSGVRIENEAEVAVKTLGSTLIDAVIALVSSSNYGAAVEEVDPAGFGLGNFDNLLSSLSSADRVVILDTGYFVKVKPTWIPPKFGERIYECSRWSAAGAKVRGFVADPKALLVRYALPADPQTSTIAREVIQLPQIGLSVEASAWMNTQTHALRAAYNVYLGVGVGDSAALKILASLN